MKLSDMIDTGLKIVVSIFNNDFFIGSEVIAFFAKTDFRHFYLYFFAYNSGTTEYFQNLIIWCERTFEDQLV